MKRNTKLYKSIKKARQQQAKSVLKHRSEGAVKDEKKREEEESYRHSCRN